MYKIYFLFFLIIIMIFLYIKFWKNNIKICLCVIAKTENLYVREFVEHYKKIGYNNIFIYDNNDKNGEKFEEVINDYIKSGYVKIIDYREKATERPQFDAYKDCFKNYRNGYDWLSFFDMDEFLELNKKYESIQEFLSDKIFEFCESIKINWIIDIRDNNLYYENKPLKERIKAFNNSSLENIHIKSIVKGNLPENFWKKIDNPHSSNFNHTSCGSSGKVIKFNSPFNNPPDFTNAQLKHYHYKSFEEYCLKIKKGRADFTKNQNKIRIRKIYKDLYSQNYYNEEKLKIINKIFNYTYLTKSKK